MRGTRRHENATHADACLSEIELVGHTSRCHCMRFPMAASMRERQPLLASDVEVWPVIHMIREVCPPRSSLLGSPSR